MQGIPDWQEGQDYKEGDEVVYKGKIYEAIRDISNACLRPNKNSAWTKLDDRIPIKDETIPCSIPQELVDAINAVIYWYEHSSTANPSSSSFGVLKHTLSKSLQGQCEMHQSLQRRQELEEAEALLTKLCIAFEPFKDGTRPFCVDVPEIDDWWAKHKPKSEREQKLEKIATEIDKVKGSETSMDIAERVLKALEEG